MGVAYMNIMHFEMFKKELTWAIDKRLWLISNKSSTYIWGYAPYEFYIPTPLGMKVNGKII